VTSEYPLDPPPCSGQAELQGCLGTSPVRSRISLAGDSRETGQPCGAQRGSLQRADPPQQPAPARRDGNSSHGQGRRGTGAGQASSSEGPCREPGIPLSSGARGTATLPPLTAAHPGRLPSARRARAAPESRRPPRSTSAAAAPSLRAAAPAPPRRSAVRPLPIGRSGRRSGSAPPPPLRPASAAG